MGLEFILSVVFSLYFSVNNIAIGGEHFFQLSSVYLSLISILSNTTVCCIVKVDENIIGHGGQGRYRVYQ